MHVKIVIYAEAFSFGGETRLKREVYLGRPYVWAFSDNLKSLPGGSKTPPNIIHREVPDV